MKRFLMICVLIMVTAIQAGAAPMLKPIPFKFESVVDGNTIKASGLTFKLWGIEPPPSNDPNAYAARLFLATMLTDGILSCATEVGSADKHCFINGHDVGSMMVVMGMAKDTTGYYQLEQETARKQMRGIWNK